MPVPVPPVPVPPVPVPVPPVLDPPAGSPEAPRRESRVSEILGIAVSWLAWVPFVGIFLGALGVTGGTWGTAWALLALSPLLLPAPLMAGRGRRGRPFLASVVLVIAAALLISTLAPPTWDRMAAAADDVRVPAGAVEVGRSSDGDEWCMSGCVEVQTFYDVPDGAESVAAMEVVLAEDHWTRHELDRGTRWCRSGYGLWFWAEPDPRHRFAEEVAPGHEVLVVEIAAGCAPRS